MEPIRVFERIRKRKTIYLSSVLLLIIVIVALLAVNIFKTSKKIKAAISCDASIPKNCTLDSDTTLSAGDITYDNSNLTVDGRTLYIAGRHTFENLTLKNSGAIRAQSLVAGTDFDQNSGEITASGANKFIDLVITGKLSISNSGVITAVGAGYPTGLPYSADPAWPTWRGYGPDATLNGPGGGRNQFSAAGLPRAAGGGSAGAGGDGNESGTVAAGGGGLGYNNSSTITSTFLPGSAGGRAYRAADSYESAGGAGGGVIRISTKEFEIFNSGTISASGANPVNCLLTSSCGGAGAGGAIYLQYQESNSQVKVDVSGGRGLNSTPGQNGLYLAEGAVLNGSVANITARGGDGSDGTNFISGAGGGGRVVIIKKQRPLASIKKSLAKVYDADYPDGTVPIDSSPYGLKPGDIIKVTLSVSNLTIGQEITIKDEIFNNGSINTVYFSRPISGSWTTFPGANIIVTDTDISWKFTPTPSQVTVTLEYQTKVQ